MGICLAKPHEERRQMHSRKSVLRSGVSRLNLALEENVGRHRRGTVSNEAVKWFMDRDERTLVQASSFMPWVIRRGMRIDTVTESTDSVVAYRGEGAIVFCDASGFTKLTESLAQKENGAELLSRVLNQFYTPLVELISHYRGDIIKFSGDALTVLFMSEPEEGISTEYDMPCGSGWARCEGHSEISLATLRASACCIEIHRRLDHFQVPGVPGVSLSFHIGVGCGTCVVLHVGGEHAPEDPRTKRFEYVICGDPLEQISHACKYALVGETVLSSSAWDLVKMTCIEGTPVVEDSSYHRLAGLNPSLHSYATIRAAATARDTRAERFSLLVRELALARRYIPSAVYMQMENGTLEYVNELRVVTVFFMSIVGVDVSVLPKGPLIAQELMTIVQRACHEQEGQVNKFLVDDKGLMFLCVFGAPPMVHTDDPLRGIKACFRIIADLSKKMDYASAYFGLTTGRVFCGLVGSSARQEYTVLGDSVNLAARFMQLGYKSKVVVDTATYENTKDQLEYTLLAPVVLKGKGSPVPVFLPGGEKSKSQTITVASDCLLACRGWSGYMETQKCLAETDVLRAGGTVVFAGVSGLGCNELSQYVVSRAGEIHPELAKVYATDTGQKGGVVVELLNTCLKLYAEKNGLQLSSGKFVVLLSELLGGLPVDILVNAGFEEVGEALDLPINIVPPSRNPIKRRYTALARGGTVGGLVGSPPVLSSVEEELVNYCEIALKKILASQPVALVLKASRGTSLFNVETSPIFWALVDRLGTLVSGDGHPLILVVVCRNRDDLKNAPDILEKMHVVGLTPLERHCIEDYVARILCVETADVLPFELLDFIQDLTQGNPLYVRETLDQLVGKKTIVVVDKKKVQVNQQALSNINLTEWSHTKMVGQVICQLEALAPQEATVVKMASVFEGPFSVLDIAASLKSPYTNATCFDNYRMFRTCARLASMGILIETGVSRFSKDTDPVFIETMKSIPLYILDNYLIRKVATGMILHQQAMKVKRQALLFRALHKELPARMEAHKTRMQALDIHYFDIVNLQ